MGFRWKKEYIDFVTERRYSVKETSKEKIEKPQLLPDTNIQLKSVEPNIITNTKDIFKKR